MKKILLLLVVSCGLMTGCVYEAPLTEDHGIPVDPAVLGLWEEFPDNPSSSPPERILILKYSETEYLIQYPTGKDAMFYRGYPVKVEGVPCVQIQVIGTADGDVGQGERKYHVVSYARAGGELEIKSLNTDLVSADIKESAALRQAFLKNKANRDLFRYPGRFRKVATKS